MRNLLVSYLEEFHPLSLCQWGFTRGNLPLVLCSLLYYTDNWHCYLDSGLDICAVFFYFSKAYRPLLQKLKDLDVHPNVLTHLSMRKQYVRVNGSSSTILSVHSGVPQGSVLGPLLFVIYVKTLLLFLYLVVHCLSLLMTSCFIVQFTQQGIITFSMQNDIDIVCSWTNVNYLKFNANKCKYMIISRKKLSTLPISTLFINNCHLERVNSYKDLGVCLMSTFNWSTHTSKICSQPEANRTTLSQVLWACQ